MFRTQSDTETIVHLYEDRGRDLVESLRGMFAFALWDSRQRVLLLARDRLGQKPLYFTMDGERLLFGSEIKAILACGDVPREVDPQALEDYLAFGFVPGSRCMFSGIRKLSAASTLVIDANRWEPSEHRYWRLNHEDHADQSISQWQDALSSKFTESVAAHRVSDVPIGAFLSGGLDSSAVTAVLSGLGGESLRTFSIGFQERRFSELDYARAVAEEIQDRTH